MQRGNKILNPLKLKKQRSNNAAFIIFLRPMNPGPVQWHLIQIQCLLARNGAFFSIALDFLLALFSFAAFPDDDN